MVKKLKNIMHEAIKLGKQTYPAWTKETVKRSNCKF